MIRDPDTGAVRYFGLYRGVIRDTKDPLGKRRARLQVPQVLFQTVTDWAYPLETAGVAAPTPQVGQGVWVQFEGGDPSYPVWTGTFGTSTTALNLALEQLSDVTIYNPADGAVLSFNAATKSWIGDTSIPPVTITGTAVTLADQGTVTNTMLAKSSVTVNGSPVSLGGTVVVQAEPYNGSVTNIKVAQGTLANDRLINSSVTVNGSSVALGGAITVQAVPTAGSVDSTKIAPGGLPTSSITNLDSYVTGYRLDQFSAPTANVGLNGVLLQNAGTPVNANDVATKGYADALVAGLNYKKEVKAATTGAAPLTGTPYTVDGVTLTAGDRILVKNQASAWQNGIYVIGTGSWVRASDATQLSAGAYVYVDQGALYADSAWVLTTNDPITVGTTDLTFVQFSGAGQIIAGNGLSKNGNQLAVVGTTGRVSVASGSVDIDAGYVGQTSITTLGTVVTGTWRGSTVDVAHGGTGATSITAGYVKGNGTGALSSVTTIPATDITGLGAVSAPTGTVMAYAIAGAPAGWLVCDGSAVSRTTYSALYNVLHSLYGAGDGSTTFNLPDMRGRVLAGYDPTQTEFSTLATFGGEKTHTLTIAEMPNHSHNFLYAANGQQYAGFPYAATGDYSGGLKFFVSRDSFSMLTIAPNGGGGAHNNLQPYLTMNYIIKT